jgi:cell pole-organizing protein PopZ
MNFKLVLAVSLCTAPPMVAYAQQNRPAANAPKPTVADVQKLVQMISGDKAKLKVYCDIGKLQEQMEEAEEKKDEKAIEALNAKADSLAQQIGPEYTKVMDGLEEVDPNSGEGKQFEAVFNTLVKQCK